MRVALEEGRETAAPPPAAGALSQTSTAGRLLLTLGGALLVATVFLGDGSSRERLFWIGTAATLVACGALGAALTGTIPWPRLTRAGVVLVGSVAGLVAVTALTIVWSVAPDLSWDYANRAFLYLALLAVGLFIGALVERAPVATAWGLTVVVAAAVGWGLAGKIAPGLYADGGRIARLRAPVDYWNALALLLAMGMPLALWLAELPRLSRRVRGLGAVLLFALVVATFLTYSRGGILVAGVAVVAWLWLSSSRLASLTTIAVALLGGLAVSAWAFRQAGLVEDLEPYSARVRDGWHLGLVLAIVGAVVWGVHVVISRQLETNARLAGQSSRIARTVAIALAALVVGVLLALALRGGDPKGWLDAQLDEFSSPTATQVAQDPSRLGSLNANNRWQWWQTAWSSFVDRPLGGTGAGTFEIVNAKQRTSALTATEPHNVPLQFLGETGIFGFVLLVVSVVAAIVAVREALRRLDGIERTATAALAAGMIAFLVHSVGDKDWDYVAVTGPLCLTLGVVVASGMRPGARSRRRIWPALGAVVLAWASLYSLAAPFFANRSVARAYELIGTQAAVDAASRAASLNPLAVEPLFAKAAAYDVLGVQVGADEALRRAVALQPENPEAWYRLADFEFYVIEEYGRAYRDALRAYHLDPFDRDIGALKDAIEQKFLELKAADCAAGKC